MRVMLSGSLLVVLLWPAMVVAGGAGSAYGLGEPEPLDSVVAAAPETPATLVESVTPTAASAAPDAALPQPFRIRLAGAPNPLARNAIPLTSGLRYQPSPFSR